MPDKARKLAAAIALIMEVVYQIQTDEAPRADPPKLVLIQGGSTEEG